MSAQLPLPLVDSRYSAGWPKWKERNDHIAQGFLRVALALKRRGIPRGSADDICHHLRWRTMLRERGRVRLKINNNRTRDLARWSMDVEPTLAGFFDTRTSPCRRKVEALDGRRHAA